jgi:hypothetical protein
MTDDRSEPVPLRAVDGVMEADYHQFLLVSDGWPDPDEEPIGGQNGLVEVRAGGITVLTGAQYGELPIHVALYDREPPLLLIEWDEVVDVSFTATGQLVFSELMGNVNRELPDVAFRGPGDYRLRFCARGRDGEDEHHAVLVWPGPPASPHVHRRADQTGAAFRDEPSEPTPVPPRDADLVAAVARLTETIAQPSPPILSGRVRTVHRSSRVPVAVGEVYEAVGHLHWWLGIGGIPAYGSGQLFTIYLRRKIRLSARGTVLAAEPSRRLHFSLFWTCPPYNWEVPDPPTAVNIDLRADSAETLVQVTHTGVPAEWAEDVDLLWAYYLDRLVAATTGAPIGHHPWDA